MPTSYGLSYSMYSLPRSACTIGACKVSRPAVPVRRGRRDARTTENGDVVGAVEDCGRTASESSSGRCTDWSAAPAAAPDRLVHRRQEHLAGDHDHGDAVLLDRSTDGHLQDARHHLGVLTSSQYTLQARNRSWGWVSWKYSEPISERGMWAAIASTGTRLRCASNRPLIRCRLPGPQLPAQTASRPVSAASAAAAKRRGLLVTDVFPGRHRRRGGWHR